MGLDGVEIVMAVEDAFDIQIEDSAAAKMLTPRVLIDYVMGKVTTTTTSVCLTQRAFNLLRRSLIRHCDLKRSQISPSTSLPSLMHRKLRRETLRKIITDLAIKHPPNLVHPNWVGAVVLGGSVLTGLFVAVLAIHEFDTIGIWIFIVATIATAAIGIQSTKPLRTEFPKELQTVGDFSRWAMTHKSDLAHTTPSGWTRDQVAARVREIIVDVLGCKPDFNENARFIEDLGLG